MPSLICKTLGLIFSLTLLHSFVFAQTSTLFKTNQRFGSAATFNLDTGKILKKARKHLNRPDTTHKPAIAVRRSAVIPGWGQVYNRTWWKLPIVYTTLGLFGRSVVVSQRSYKQYLEVYKLVNDPTRPRPPVGDPVRTLYEQNSGSTPSRLDNIQSNYQRNMQLSVLSFIGFWGVQVIDAYIDAKFIHSYSIDRNLSVDITPGIAITQANYPTGNAPLVTPVMKLLVTI
ncbi:DUF5683 domain-containing protein [Mucilaginibacter galii]|uniref:DUF5683 domain-containing protein n=1 Tax=Mucilaginibacter galii TaxID=2005073 RepID=A0A917JAJ7_9SPHI|nr:DUF5683 domain-containing protein [Mucilaginibacter galii]GGI52195.1 hypothetical protein GCM10011425_34070 [Mucilaginibacter galii]